MPGATITAIFVILILILIPIAVLVGQATRRRGLQQRFGPEYDKLVADRPSRRKAEAELAGRQRRVRKLGLRDLTDEGRRTYETRWTEIQERFVDDPADAIGDAQALIESVMRERGYPVSGYEQTVADLSVAHARTLGRFRSAHEVSERAAAGQATTEELRVALLGYRELVGDLLGGGVIDVVAAPPAADRTTARAVKAGEEHVGAA